MIDEGAINKEIKQIKKALKNVETMVDKLDKDIRHKKI